MDLRLSLTHILLAVFLSLGLLTAYQFVPTGKVTVVGEAKSEQKTQVATFNAGVMVVSNDKDGAASEVNSKMEAIIKSVKEFGIAENDIKTQSLSVYKQVQQPTNGEWRVSNDISIKLRNIDKASELADLLTKSGATSVYGPRFTVDDTKQAESGLVDQAIKNAAEKAEAIAKASGRKLGKVIEVTEGYSSGGPIYALRDAAGGGGAPIEPGSETVSKTVTVTFELE